MNSARKWTTWPGTAIIVAVAALVVAQILASDRQGEARAQDATSSGEAPAGKPVRVAVTGPTRRPLTRVLNMPATLFPGESAELFAKTSGYVASVSVDIGSTVAKGDALLVIDVPEMLDELKQAEAVLAAKRSKVRASHAKVAQAQSMVVTAKADVQRAQAEHELRRITAGRQETLRKERAISQQVYDEVSSRLAIAEAELHIVQAGVESAEAERQAMEADVAVAESVVAVEEANVRRLKTLMAYATIRAPFGGVITDRMVDPGAFVRSAAEGVTTALLTIARVDYIRLALEIPESDVVFVHDGTKVEINIKSAGGDTIVATVTRTAKSIKPATRTMRVEVDLDNTNGRLSPGMYAQVVVRLESKAEALLIPSKAIRIRGRDLSVLVAEGSRAGGAVSRATAIVRSVPVSIGYDDGIWAEVTDGLAGDEQIIVSATSQVTPGVAVIPVPAG